MVQDLAGMMLDQIAMLTHRSALDAWLGHPKTARFRERLQHTPAAAATWLAIETAIAAAEAWTIDDREENTR